MIDFLYWIFANALFCVGSVIAFIACIGFLIFLRGVLLGITQVFYLDGHDDHVGHARVNSVWGVVIMVNMFALWVLIRGVATMLNFDNANLPATGKILVAYAILVFIAYYKGWAFAKGGGH